MKELAQIPLFQGFDEPHLEALAEVARHQSLRRDCHVFFQGDVSDSLYVVLSGSIKIYRESIEGHETVLSILGPNQLFGELALFDGQPRSASAVTLEATTLLVVNQRDFRRFAMKSPEVLWWLLEALSARIRGMTDERSEILHRGEAYRLVRTLLKLGDRATPASSGAVHVTLSWKDLAAMVGVSVERVRALAGRLETRSLVELIDEGLSIPDLAALRKSLPHAEEL